jgi:hypothetical protein
MAEMGCISESGDVLFLLSDLARRKGAAERGARLLGAAERLRATSGGVSPLPERERQQAREAALRDALDEKTFTAAGSGRA